MTDAPQDEKYWYNTKTQQVEKGRQSSWENRMGPYDSRGEAEAALARAKARNEAWDAQDEDD